MSHPILDTERQAPASIEVERAVLGALLLGDANIRSEAFDLVQADYFHDVANRRIWEAAIALMRDDAPLELTTLTEELHRRRQIEAVGGVDYLSSLVDGVVERPSIAHYINILRGKASLRRLISVAQKAISEAVENQDSPATVISRAETAISHLSIEAVPATFDPLVPWGKFSEHGAEKVDWLVDGVIEVGTNGFMLGMPKASKSFVAASLAVSLLSGRPWMGFNVLRRRVGLVSREDYAGTTSRRLKQLFRGADVDPGEEWISDNFVLNSRAESKHLMLTDSGHLRSLIQSLKRHNTEFLILDVLKVMHDSDENDAKEMGAVLRRVEQIRDEVGCQVCIVHHSRKNWDDGMTLSEITRGSSVIAGFAEFLIGLRLVDEVERIRQIKFETKADMSPRPFYWKIEPYEVTRSLTLVRTEWEPPKKTRRVKPAF